MYRSIRIYSGCHSPVKQEAEQIHYNLQMSEVNQKKLPELDSCMDSEEAEESVVSLFKLELVLQADKQKVSAAVVSKAIVRFIKTPHKNRIKCPDRVELSIMVLQTIATPHGWHGIMRLAGFEPTIFRLKVRCSTN